MSTSATPVQLIDPNTGLPYSAAPVSSGPQPVQGDTASGSTDSGNPVKVGARVSNGDVLVNAGTRTDLLTDNNSNLKVAIARGASSGDGTFPNLSFVQLRGDIAANPLGVQPYNLDGASVSWRQRGDATGAWSHAPQSTPTDASGTIAASGGTASLTFTNTTQGELINSSTATFWARWNGTPAVNGPGSFPIAPGNGYSKDRVAGTLQLLSTAANQPYTFTKFG